MASVYSFEAWGEKLECQECQRLGTVSVEFGRKGEGASGNATSEPRPRRPEQEGGPGAARVNAGASEHTYPPDRRRAPSAPSEGTNGRTGEGAPVIITLSHTITAQVMTVIYSCAIVVNATVMMKGVIAVKAVIAVKVIIAVNAIVVVKGVIAVKEVVI